MQQFQDISVDTNSSIGNKLLSSMAILQVNWEYERKSYLDNFLPFVVEAMRRNEQPSYTDANICELLRQEFAVEIPDSVVHSLLRRAKKEGLGKRDNTGNFIPDETLLRADTRVADKQASFLRQQRSLVEGFVGYAKDSFDLAIDEETASSELLSFVDTYAASILGAAQRGERLDGEPHKHGRTEEIALAAYFEYLNDRKPLEFEYLVSVTKGAMLASSIFRDVPSAAGDRFENTDLYLDTPVLFRALGFLGPAAQSAQLAMISGAITFGAGVKCFEDTLSEVRSVIEAIADNFRGNRASSSFRSIGSFFIEQGFTPEEVRSVATKVERDLNRAGIEVVSRPSHSYGLTVDEVELARIIEGAAVTYSRAALNHDVDALTAIYFLRKRRSGDRIERSRATFVTTNPRVIAGSDQLPDFQREQTPVAMLEDRVSTLIWIKTPLAYPDLPRDQIVARVSALLSPSGQVWTKYMEQIDRLRARGTIDDADEILLRQHYEARRVLVRETMNDPAHVSEASVSNVLEKVKTEIRRPLEAETGDLKVAHAIKEQYLQTQALLARQQAGTHSRRLRERARTWSSAISTTLHWLLFGTISTLLVFSFLFDWWAVAKIVQGLLLVTLVFGNLLAPLTALRERVRIMIEAALLHLFVLDDEPEAHMG